MGESSLTNLHAIVGGSSPHNDFMGNNFGGQKNSLGNLNQKRAIGYAAYQQTQDQKANLDYSYSSNNNNSNNMGVSSSNNLNYNGQGSNNSSLISAKGGGFFPNLRTKHRESSNLAQNGQNNVFANSSVTRIGGANKAGAITLPSLNDSNLNDEPASSYFHTSSNPQLPFPAGPSTYQISLQAVGQGYSQSVIDHHHPTSHNSIINLP